MSNLTSVSIANNILAIHRESIKFSDVEKIPSFISSLQRDTYPEPISTGHRLITRSIIEQIAGDLPNLPWVLDIGCGQGVALDEFRARKWHAVGITNNPEDLYQCQISEHEVHNMDMHFMRFIDARFDMVWARHVLEHSPIPLFVIHEISRILKPGGLLYVEVPAPDTCAKHETHKNHYSVLTANAWISLLSQKSGFHIEKHTEITIQLECGPDVYFSFLCRKPNSIMPDSQDKAMAGEPAILT
jgi:SAM-dependent methyltransferase